MTREYLITVLIPCHSLRYLPNAIESICRQTIPHQDFEVFVVADRIDLEEAKNILRKSGLNFRVIKTPEPGIVAALNLGLRNITSEFVARMDEDDLMLPRRLELQHRHLLRNKETAVIGGQIQLIDIDGQVIGNSRYKKRIRKHSISTLQSSPIAHPAAMFRRSSVETIGGYRNFLPEDWDLWVRLGEYGPIENLPETILSYRVHPNQLSREKMYAQNLGREFVSVSYFARLSKIRDAPTASEDKSVWLEETRTLLRITSKAFCRFEKRSQKKQLAEGALQEGFTVQSFQKVLSIFFKSPIFTSTYLLIKVRMRIRLLLEKSK